MPFQCWLIIGDWGRFSNVDSIIPKLDAEKQKLITRTLKREVESLSDMARSKVKDCLTEFLNNVDDILFSNIPDFDSRDFLKSVSKEIQMELQNEDMFTLIIHRMMKMSLAGEFLLGIVCLVS